MKHPRGVSTRVANAVQDPTNAALQRVPGAVDGLATLDSMARVPTDQLPASIYYYQTSWNATTDTPHLSGTTPTVGFAWSVSVAGSTTLGAISSWSVGDFAVYGAAGWTKIPSGGVLTFAGRSGAVVPVAGDYGPTLGGTGQTTYAIGDMLVCLGADTLSKITTTAYGRAFLALVNQAGLVALLPSYQPLDAALTALAAAGAITTGDILAAPAGVPAWSSLAETGVQATAAILDAIAALSAAGLVARTGSGTVAARTITGTANRLTVNNGNGVSGNPTLDVGADVYVAGGTDVAVADGGTGAGTAAGGLAGLTPYTSSSSSTPTLAATAVDFGLSNAAPTVTLLSIASYPANYQGVIRNVSGATQTVSLDPDGSEVVNQGSAGAVVSFTLLANAVLGLKIISSTAWSVSVLSAGLATTAFEIRLTGGSWFAYPQGWTGLAWVDTGAGIALTVEAAGTYTTSGATITIPSGTASNTTPAVTSSYRAYIALSALSIWSTTYGRQYAVDLTCSFGSAVANARFGYAFCFPTGSYDANAETLFSERIGYTGSNYTTQVSQGTGTYAQAYLGAAVPTLSRVAFFPALANAAQVANGTAPDGGAMTIPVTLPTHLYVLGGAAVGATGGAVVVIPSIRLIALTGGP